MYGFYCFYRTRSGYVATAGYVFRPFSAHDFLAVVFYFLIIRPQSKRAKEHKNLLAELRKGDEVVTNGGMLGRVVKIGENFVEVEVTDNVKLRVQKQADCRPYAEGHSEIFGLTAGGL